MTKRSRVLATASLLLLTAFAAPAAEAKTAQVTCPQQPVSQVFAPWKDKALYSLIPNGGLDAGAGDWLLGSGATLVPGSQPLLGAPGGNALQLRKGASAVSPAFCVALDLPSGRAFARSLGGKAKLHVAVLHLSESGWVVASSAWTDFDITSAWAPTRSFSLSPDLSDKLGGRVRLMFTLLEGTGAQLDDVFADPRLAK